MRLVSEFIDPLSHPNAIRHAGDGAVRYEGGRAWESRCDREHCPSADHLLILHVIGAQILIGEHSVEVVGRRKIHRNATAFGVALRGIPSADIVNVIDVVLVAKAGDPYPEYVGNHRYRDRALEGVGSLIR